MAKMAEFDKELRIKIVAAYKQGDGYTTFSKRLNIPRLTICNIVKKYELHYLKNKLMDWQKTVNF